MALALQQKLRTGERLSLLTFDPMTLEDRTISLEVTDDSVFLVPDSAEFDSSTGAWLAVHSDTIRAWKLSWTDGSQAATMWVDGRGLPIRISSPTGLELDRSAFEIVTINYRRRRPARGAVRPQGIIPRTTVASQVKPEADVSAMQVEFTAAGSKWTMPEAGDSQAISDSTKWLEDGPYLGIRDTAIVQRAHAILGNETEPRRIALLLAQWVSRNIGGKSEPAVPRAATVLRNRQADVDGHTVLFVALARAAGLPTRPVSGIVLAENRFYLHSWAEVHLEGWVPVDPTWGEVPASGNRVRFRIGSLSRPVELLPLLAGIDARLITLTRRP